MLRTSAVSLLIGAIMVSLGGISPSHADACAGKIEQFNEAVDAGREADAQSLVDQIATDGVCGRFQVPVQRRLAALRLRMAQDLMAKGRPSGEYERVLADAARPGVLWQAAATLAEVRFGARRFGEAALAFDAAIETVKNETVTPTAPSKAEIQELIDRAALSRVLEANVGSRQTPPTYVAALDDRRSGMLGGYLSPSVRGIVPHALPLPIIFDFDKATLTPLGQDATRELARAIREQQPSKVVVVGHTDVRGETEHNLKLSKERAEAVATYMRESGVDIPIQANGVGATEPIKIEDSAGLTQDDIYALNRRVEWLRE
ncbi:OmpA family protein [Lichenifustis flavocetrariae]|uniref:OmpA family protein n=1 Tax=Lichenifustis flavocetrariae TaxID=2949735 RepID=A0AA41YSX8_9HYPH|nr:OmpA family protein [Lichenifustis flavocetrariae]MCW6506735.1 OmpA family protein [Lichenifustis flavocetrariae]